MRFFIIFLLFPILGFAKVYQEITDPKMLAFLSVAGPEPANEIILQDDSRMWVHGCAAGSRVTINDVPAKPGEYQIKDSDHIIKVDEKGKLVESIKNIKNITCIGTPS